MGKAEKAYRKWIEAAAARPDAEAKAHVDHCCRRIAEAEKGRHDAENVFQVITTDLAIPIKTKIPFFPEGTPPEEMNRAVEEWKSLESNYIPKRGRERAKAKEAWGRCTLELSDGSTGTIIHPDGTRLNWGVISNFGYYALFGDLPKEKVFGKVVRLAL